MFFSKSILAVYSVCPVGVFRPVPKDGTRIVIVKCPLSYLGNHCGKHLTLPYVPPEAQSPGPGSGTPFPVGSLSPACLSSSTSAQAWVWMLA